MSKTVDGKSACLIKLLKQIKRFSACNCIFHLQSYDGCHLESYIISTFLKTAGKQELVENIVQ